MNKSSRTTRSLVLAALVLLASGPAARKAGALEFGLSGSAGNLGFPWTQLSQVPGTDPYPADNYYWGGSAFFSMPLGEDASFGLTFERDPVLRHVLGATVQFERGIAKISVGPFFGLFNSADAPFNAGLSTSVRFQWPGIAYVSARSDGAIAIGVLADALGAEPQARAELAAGFYTPNAIISAAVGASSFSESDSGGKTVTDALSSYLLTIDIFKKNVPYTLFTKTGLQIRSKYYEATDTTDALGSLVMGLTATVEAMPGWKISGSFTSGVFVFGLEELTGQSPAGSDFFFDASFGVSFDTDKLAKAAKARAKVPAAEPAAEPATEPTMAPAPDETAQPPAGELGPDEEVPPPLGYEGPAKGFWYFGAGAGLSYNFAPLPEGPFSFLAVLFNFRGGAWVDGTYRFTSGLGLGGEVGLQYITTSLSFDGGATSVSVSVFDLPLRAKVSYDLGFLIPEAFLGLMTTGSVATGSTLSAGFGLDLGCRVKLGSFYLEGSYVIGLGADAVSYPRVSAGFCMSLDRLFANLASPATPAAPATTDGTAPAAGEPAPAAPASPEGPTTP